LNRWSLKRVGEWVWGELFEYSERNSLQEGVYITNIWNSIISRMAMVSRKPKEVAGVPKGAEKLGPGR
jgi:hypothetical protein